MDAYDSNKELPVYVWQQEIIQKAKKCQLAAGPNEL